MKKVFIFILTLLCFYSFAQECEITVEGETPICPGNYITLSVEYSDTLKYLWLPGDDTISSIVVNPDTTTKYFVKVYNENYNCEDSAIIDVYPKINIEFEQLERTCAGIDANCEAQVKAIASGEFSSDEYTYIWDVQWVDPGDSSLALGLCGNITYNLQIIDNYACKLDTSYKVKSFRSPEIKITADPDSIVYIKNPWITFSFDNLSIDTLEVTNWEWDFLGDSSITSTQKSPRHLYTEEGTYNVLLKITDTNGCDTTYTFPVEVKPVKLLIPNIITPNGDGKNDELMFVEDSGETGYELDKVINDYYISNELVIFNRWGKKIYEINNYKNDWDGGNLSDGVYFYILKCHGEFGDDIFKSSLTIIGSGK